MKSGEGSADLRLLLALVAVIAALFFAALPLTLPEVRASNAPDEFDAVRAKERLARILGGETPHPVDTDENDAVRERLLAEIAALGFAPEVRDDFTCRSEPDRSRAVCARVQNVLFRAGPPGSDAVMIASHYDSVPAGPGASDDGIGVAVSLEIAKLLADAPPARPVVFLITDGEEMGLIGAHSFMATDPLAEEIDAVINLEARGVRGPAQMFQTSAPNSADVAAFVNGARRPFANSMMTDIYRLLPNDTDLTEFLAKDYQAINLALTEGVEFYHTPHDSLANLDPRSVQHMGDNALQSLRNFEKPELAAETQVIFTDILSRFTVTLPQWLGGAIIALGLLLAAAALLRDNGARPIRAFFAPPLIVVLAGGIAYALQYALGALRPEAAYWMAFPQAMQGVAYFSAALAAIVSLKWIAAGAGGTRVLHAGWFWLGALAAAGWFVAPGASILYALPLVVYIAGAALSFVAPAAFRPFAIAAALLALIIFTPALHLAEIGLGFATAAIFAVVAASIFMVAAPLALGGETRVGLAPFVAVIAALTVSVGAALAVPAYSEAKPQPLNIQYYVDADAKDAKWLLSTAPGEPAPKAMEDVAPFARLDIEGLAKARLAAPAPFLETAAPEIVVVADETAGDARTLRVAIAANGADQVLIRIPEEARAAGFVQGARAGEFGIEGPQSLYCFGRACDGAEFEVTLRAAAPADWLVFGVQFGLPYGAWPLVNARPATATPIQNGDVIIVRTKKTI